MDNATLLTAGLATHMKIVAIAVVAALMAGLVGTTAQMRPEGSRPPLQTTDHAPSN